MDTIVVEPRNAEEANEMLVFLEKINAEAEVYPVRTKEEVLTSIEKGADEVARHLKGELELKDARQLSNEL